MTRPTSLRGVAGGVVVTILTAALWQGPALAAYPWCTGRSLETGSCTDQIAHGKTAHFTDAMGFVQAHVMLPTRYDNDVLNIHTTFPAKVTLHISPSFAHSKVHVQWYLSKYNQRLSLANSNSYELQLYAIGTVGNLATIKDRLTKLLNDEVTAEVPDPLCTPDWCVVTLKPIPYVQEKMAGWLYDNTTAQHNISVEIVVDVTSNSGDNGLTAESSHRFTLNPMLPEAGCMVVAPAAPAAALLLGFLPLLLVGRHRASSRRVLHVLALLGLLLPQRAGALSIITTDSSSGQFLEAAYQNNALTSAIQILQLSHGVTGPLAEGAHLTYGVHRPDGSCAVDTITIAASSEGAGVEQVAHTPITFYVNAEDCEVYVSYLASDGAAPPSTTGDEVPQRLPVAALQAGSHDPVCTRAINVRMRHYNGAALALPLPWPFPSAVPTGFLRWTRSPSTIVAIGGFAYDLGTQLVEPSQPYVLHRALPPLWEAEPGPSGYPPLPPALISVTPTLYNVQSIRYFIMPDTWWSELMFDPPSGYEHHLTAKFSMQPAGKIDLLMAATGILPNVGLNWAGPIPRLPYVGTFVGDYYLEADGPYCPGAWQRIPMGAPCGPGDPSCWFVTNYPG